MNDVQELLRQLRKKGWTLSAIADELPAPRNNVDRWYRGARQPSNASSVALALYQLLTRNDIPKKRRSGGSEEITQPKDAHREFVDASNEYEAANDDYKALQDRFTPVTTVGPGEPLIGGEPWTVESFSEIEAVQKRLDAALKRYRVATQHYQEESQQQRPG